MVSNSSPIDDADDTCVPSPFKLFSLLEQQHRRLALQYLLDHNCPVSLDAIVMYLIEHESVSANDRRRLSVELHHNHLPRLADYGCLRYDVETNTVEQVFDDGTLRSLFERATDSNA
ncbi:hypothetical protein [Haladaptatus sp. DYF46]|uniref:DUF7344 domain-containing protein n=1 Tax=Haladaptatus sp. DYF46 TaxID=2886041 RepID=UPI001E5ED7A8|nr:hypothetical protein [Haladaptatus sp. DYF46]